jgi:flagellin
MVINTNIAAQTSADNLAMSTGKLNQALSELSSGSKITSPADDPAGSAVSLRFNAQINRTGAAEANVSNAISFAQTQDGYLQQVGNALNRMSELSVMSQDVTKTDADRALYDKEYQTLGTYINDTATKDFNGVSLFSGTTLNVTTDGEGNGTNSTFGMTGISLTAGTGAAYAKATADGIATSSTAATALTDVKSAITQLATDQATLGANVSRLTYVGDQLSVLSNNLTAANSQITDVDVAQESTQYAKYQILVQAGTSMLAQANQVPQNMLKLLS